MVKRFLGLPPYRISLAGSLLAAREAVMAPVRPILRETGVTEQQWRVLHVLSNGQSQDATSLGQEALLHAPSLTRILKQLAARNLIIRSGDPADGRRVIIQISDAGLDIVMKVAAHTRAIYQIYDQIFERDRLDFLMRELISLAETVDSHEFDRLEDDQDA